MLQPPISARKKITDQEQTLVNLAHRLDAGWSAVYIHLSKISKAKRNENIVFALQMFEQFVKSYDGHFLIMKNGDWVFIYRDVRITEIRSAISRLRHLFAGDPLYYSEEKYEVAFATWYDLDRDRTEFTRLAEMLLAQRMIDPAPVVAEPAAVTPDDHLRRKASELVSLGRILDAVDRTDLTSVLRRQPVCLIAEGSRPKDLFEEVYFSIPDLEALLRRGSLMSDDLWTFHFVTRALDLKLLSFMSEGCRGNSSPNISVNLNICSVLAPEFLQFDEGVSEEAKRSIAFEFQFTDVFTDVGGFLYARGLLRERGYSIFLDGVTDINLSFVDRQRIGADLIKIRWSPSLAESRFRAEYKDLIRGDEAGQIILCRCDSDEALRLGQELGISLFQGRYVSGLLAPGASEPPFLASLRPAAEKTAATAGAD